MLKFNSDGTLASDNVFSTQIHEDYPNKKDIDKLTDDQVKAIYVHSPFGYLMSSSSISNYFCDRAFDLEDKDTKLHKQMYTNFKPKVKDYVKENKEATFIQQLIANDLL